MTDPIVERVARAIHNAVPHKHEWDDNNDVVRKGGVVVTAEELREEWRNVARAALEAADIDELVEALKPFAREAEDWHPKHIFGDSDKFAKDPSSSLTLGDLRRAAAALSRFGSDDKGATSTGKSPDGEDSRAAPPDVWQQIETAPRDGTTTRGRVNAFCARVAQRLQAENNRLRAEIERLTAERDQVSRNYADLYNKGTLVEIERDRLRKALTPFAALADYPMIKKSGPKDT